jgi:hypothetical protein
MDKMTSTVPRIAFLQKLTKGTKIVRKEFTAEARSTLRKNSSKYSELCELGVSAVQRSLP